METAYRGLQDKGYDLSFGDYNICLMTSFILQVVNLSQASALH